MCIDPLGGVVPTNSDVVVAIVPSTSVDYIGHIARAYSPDHVSVQIGSCPLPSHDSFECTCRCNDPTA